MKTSTIQANWTLHNGSAWNPTEAKPRTFCAILSARNVPCDLFAAEAEDGVEQEERSVDDGEGALGDADVLGLLVAERHVLEVADREDASSDKQSAADQAEEDVLREAIKNCG